MDKIYHFFLYWLGFPEGEHITDMLRRQKDRLGVRTWAIITLVGIMSLVGGLLAIAFHVLGAL